MGIWPAGSDATDVNTCELTASRQLLVCGGDDGAVKLFNAPCVVHEAPYVVGTGHSTAISCTRFLRGDRLVVSAGGGDRAVVLWEVQTRSGTTPRAGNSALPPMPSRVTMVQAPIKDIE